MLTINRFLKVKPLHRQNKIIHTQTGIIMGIMGTDIILIILTL